MSVRKPKGTRSSYRESAPPGGRWSRRATRDVVFGFARMFQLSMGDTSVEVAVFRDLKEAENWLAER